MPTIGELEKLSEKIKEAALEQAKAEGLLVFHQHNRTIVLFQEMTRLAAAASGEKKPSESSLEREAKTGQAYMKALMDEANATKARFEKAALVEAAKRDYEIEKAAQ